jgi:hypothetical protein
MPHASETKQFAPFRFPFHLFVASFGNLTRTPSPVGRGIKLPLPVFGVRRFYRNFVGLAACALVINYSIRVLKTHCKIGVITGLHLSHWFSPD